jgi:hypothetical protein
MTITNMFDVRMVNQLSGLEKPQIFDIMTNYAKYEKEFGLSVGSAE